jgi:hypothetical protein
MDSAQTFVLDLGWIFFAVWGMVLAALGVVAFGPDLVHEPRGRAEEQRLKAQ